MFKRIQLIAMIVITTSTTSVSCSSEEDEQNSVPRYEINPPSWLQGKWEDKQWINAYYRFTSDNIYTYIGDENWKENYNDMNRAYWENPSGTLDAHSVSVYDIKKTENHYEAVVESYRVHRRLSVEKVNNNEIIVNEKNYNYKGEIEQEKQFNCIRK